MSASAVAFRSTQRPPALTLASRCECNACRLWLQLGEPDRELAPAGRWPAHVVAVGRSRTRREVGGGLHTRYQGADRNHPWRFALEGAEGANGPIVVEALWSPITAEGLPERGRGRRRFAGVAPWRFGEGDRVVLRVAHTQTIRGLAAVVRAAKRAG